MKISSLTGFESHVLQTPINFPVFVAGKQLVASIDEIVDNTCVAEFHIWFSDGYSDYFTMTESGYVEGGRTVPSKRYAAGIRADLTVLIFLSPGRKTWNFRYRESNAWILQGLSGTLDLYFDGDYRFHLYKEADKWRVHDTRLTPRDIDETLVKRAIEVIDRSL